MGTFTEEDEELIEQEMLLLAIKAEAQRRLAESVNPYDVPEFRTISEVPARPKWRVDDLLPTDGYALLSAQKKVGKTTVVLNLIRALISGGMFLGEFRVHGKAKVGLIDLEMSDFHLASWQKDSGLLGNDRLVTMSLRGQAKALGLFDDDRREKIVYQIQDHAVDVLIVDPIGPLMRACGVDENSNTEVGKVVDLIYSMAKDAGVSELVIVHHHGKSDGRGGRGGSVLEDTPDALWQLKRDDRESLVTLSAFGRDVDVTRDLVFDPDTRTLTTLQFGDLHIPVTNRKALLDALRDAGEPLSGSDVWKRGREHGYTAKQEQVNDDLRELGKRGDVKNVSTGKWGKWVHGDQA